jgi:hypothetical protein
MDAGNSCAESAAILEDRDTYIGGSEAYELLYQKQYGRGCARALAYRKLDTEPDFLHVDITERAKKLGAIMNRGHMLEDLVARLYMDATGRSLIRVPKLRRHPDYPRAAVHTDRMILAQNGLPTGDCELKTHGEGPFYGILRNGLPPGHNLQLQWSMFCTGHTWGAFVIMGVFGELPLKYFDVKRDEEIMALFAKAVEEFWGKLQAGDLPPQLADPSDIRCKACPYRLTCRGEQMDVAEYQHLIDDGYRNRPITRVHNDELADALGDRQIILSEIEALDSDSRKDPGALQLVNERIRQLLGDEEAVEVNGRWRVYHHFGTWSGLDQSRLKFEKPDLYKDYYISGRKTEKRKLRVYAVAKR